MTNKFDIFLLEIFRNKNLKIRENQNLKNLKSCKHRIKMLAKRINWLVVHVK